MGNGSNERTWEVEETLSFTSLDFNLASPFQKESYCVLRTAPTLYCIKEALVANDWRVISSSYRTDATGSTYPTQSATTGQNPGVAQPNRTKFAMVEGDSWVRYSSSLHTGDSIFDAENPIDINQMHRIIYPVSHNLTSSKNDQSIVNTAFSTVITGSRSWCLLKYEGDINNTGIMDGGLRQHEAGKSLYMVLDYVSSHAGNNSVFTSSVSTAGTDNNLFGHTANIVYFYGEPDNLATINTYERPYRSDELSFSAKYTSINRISNAGNVLINPNENGARSIKINATANTEYRGFYIIVSQTGLPTFILGADKISDSLSDNLTTKQAVGNVIFMAYSTIARAGFNLADGVSISDLFMFQKNTDNNSAGLYIPYSNNWSKLYFYNGLGYFRNVPTSISDNASPTNKIFTTFPIYAVGDSTPTQSSLRGLLSFTENNSSTTRDGTYLEYPLPLLDAFDDISKIRYTGRFADVKLGPAKGINGAMGRTGTSYDRILIGGIWFPWNSEAPPDL